MTEEKKKETKKEKKEESPREESKEMKEKDPATEEEKKTSTKAEDTKADEASKPKGEEEETEEEASGAGGDEPDEEDDAKDEEEVDEEDDADAEDEEPSRASRQEADDGVKGRRLSFGLNTVIFAALVIVGLVLVNVVSSRIYERADLTEDGLYSLSDSSKKLVKKLPRDLKVKLFVSKELLPGYTSTARYVKDLLDEYKNASNGRFKWEIIHPELDEKYKKEAERYGVKSFVARAKSANALEAKTITFGMVIEYNKPDSGDTVEVLPRLLPGIERNIEYLITERIKRLTVKRKKILFVSGHGEFPARARQKVEGFLQGMFNQYEVVIGQVNKKVAKDVDLLVLMTPEKTLHAQRGETRRRVSHARRQGRPLPGGRHGASKAASEDAQPKDAQHFHGGPDRSRRPFRYLGGEDQRQHHHGSATPALSYKARDDLPSGDPRRAHPRVKKDGDTVPHLISESGPGLSWRTCQGEALRHPPHHGIVE